jgi:hypothetical protein
VTSRGQDGSRDQDGRPRRPEASNGHELDPSRGHSCWECDALRYRARSVRVSRAISSSRPPAPQGRSQRSQLPQSHYQTPPERSVCDQDSNQKAEHRESIQPRHEATEQCQNPSHQHNQKSSCDRSCREIPPRVWGQVTEAVGPVGAAAPAACRASRASNSAPIAGTCI